MIGRKAVQERSGGLCERCAQLPAAHVHHRQLRSQGGSDLPSNLLHICSPCHVTIHAQPSTAYENGWMVRSWADPAATAVRTRPWGGPAQLVFLHDDGGWGSPQAGTVPAPPPTQEEQK